MFKRLILLYSLCAFPAHAGTIVYQNDFESGVPGAEVSGPGVIVGSSGFSNVGFGNNLLQNTSGNLFTENIEPVATSISLTNLPDHISVDFGFLLAIINSWGGTITNGSPDFFQVFLDGTLLFSETFSNFADRPQSASISNRILDPVNLGFGGDPRWPESAYDFINFSAFTNIAHTSDNLTLSFIAAGAGWEGGLNESFGVDNITISLNTTAVPEPGTFALFCLGLLGVFRRFI